MDAIFEDGYEVCYTLSLSPFIRDQTWYGNKVIIIIIVQQYFKHSNVYKIHRFKFQRIA